MAHLPGQRRLRLRMLLLTLPLAGGAIVTSAFAEGAGPGKSELNGMSIAMVSASKRAPNSVAIRFTLQWTDVRNPWRLRPEEPISITFWDRTGEAARPVAVASDRVPLSPEFLKRTAKSSSLTVVAAVPSGARAMSLALGASSLETARIPLPKP